MYGPVAVHLQIYTNYSSNQGSCMMFKLIVGHRPEGPISRCPLAFYYQSTRKYQNIDSEILLIKHILVSQSSRTLS